MEDLLPDEQAIERRFKAIAIPGTERFSHSSEMIGKKFSLVCRPVDHEADHGWTYVSGTIIGFSMHEAGGISIEISPKTIPGYSAIGTIEGLNQDGRCGVVATLLPLEAKDSGFPCQQLTGFFRVLVV